MPPILTLHKYNPANNKKNIFTFEASEEIEIKRKSDPKTFVDMTITGQLPSYIFDYNLEFSNKSSINRNLEDKEFYTEIKVILLPNSTILDNDVNIY